MKRTAPFYTASVVFEHSILNQKLFIRSPESRHIDWDSLLH